MKIGFYTPQLCLQGTTVACFDYATHNQSLLGNKSVVFYDKNHKLNNQLVVDRFSSNIELIGLDGIENMDALESELKNNSCDAVYMQKCGLSNDGRFINNTPMFIHACGCENDPHGLVYAYVSEWLSKEFSNYSHPFVPLMTHLPEHKENLRKELGIPDESIVFSRLGGYYSWNIPFVNEVIKYCLDLREDIYFLFVQTHKFIDHPRVIHIEPFTDLHTKRKFINTSDAHLHARFEGESFGLTCAEYSICNKPIITFGGSRERNHIFTLKEKGIYYNSANELVNIILNFSLQDKDYNAYKDFSPEKIINKFKSVFLDKL